MDDQRDCEAVPKCVVTTSHYDWENDRPPMTPAARFRHLRSPREGLHQNCIRICPKRLRGTYAGVGHPVTIDYLKKLGVTAVELMPVHAFLDDRHLVDTGPAELLGLQHHQLLRAGSALLQLGLRQASRSANSRAW